VGVLKDYGPDADMTIDEPEGFDRSEFDGLNITSQGKSIPVESVLTYGKLPGGKYMLNWPGGHGNDVYLQIVEMPIGRGRRHSRLPAPRP
ncbi:MAG: FAD-dependent oxidoreductase, partial [Bacteroidales bacterium]|nr:FAD-dependent oxidoreductase [Candidatus Cryptobacteroides faecihippi]